MIEIQHEKVLKSHENARKPTSKLFLNKNHLLYSYMSHLCISIGSNSVNNFSIKIFGKRVFYLKKYLKKVIFFKLIQLL